MDRIKWNPDMYNRCMKKANCMVTDNIKNTSENNKNNKKVQSNQPCKSKHSDNDVKRPASYVNEGNIKKENNYNKKERTNETQKENHRSDSNEYMANTKNDIHGVGVGQCIECQIISYNKF